MLLRAEITITSFGMPVAQSVTGAQQNTSEPRGDLTLHAAPAATKQLQYVYRTLFAAAALFWAAATRDMITNASGNDEMYWAVAAGVCAVIATLLWGVFTILRRHENTTLFLLGVMDTRVTQGPGDGAPTGPFPAAVPLRQRGAA